MKKKGHALGAILLLSVAQCFAAGKTQSNDASGPELRPQHIDIEGDQNIIEKAFEPGSEEADKLAHARRSTVYIARVVSSKHGIRTGFHRSEDLQFGSQGSAFIYGYPTPRSKQVTKVESGSTGSGRKTNEHGIWIVTCKHVVNGQGWIGVRLNTTTGKSITYVTAESSWKKDHRADVAVLRFTAWRNLEVDFAMLEYTQAAEKDRLVSNAIYEGTPVALTGYPVGMLRSTDRNYPVVQYGYIAQIQGYLADDPGHDVFLVGGAAFPGNSGGPVLIPAGTPKAVTRYFRRGLLLGMVCAQRLAPTIVNRVPTTQISQSAHLAQIVPMGAIHKAIELSGDW